ncbi:TPA: endonuclease VII domain-containing protein [Klebsiella pneumoniae]
MQSYPSALPNSSPLSEGLLKTCSECAEEKPISEFTFDKRRGSYTSKCTKCRTKKTKEWRDKNPNYEKERYGVNEDRDRWRHIKRKYGISKEEYVEMLDSQGGRCAICGDEPGERYSHQLHVDHCHASGKVRGLLCRGCNHMLGVIKDDEVLLFKAVEYLRKSQRNSLKHS